MLTGMDTTDTYLTMHLPDTPAMWAKETWQFGIINKEIL